MSALEATPTAFDGLSSYISSYAQDMSDRVASAIRPLYDPERDALSPAVLQLAEGKGMHPFPAQAVTIEALCRTLERLPYAFLVGEMGVGKTPMALWLAACLMRRSPNKPMRFAVSAPNQLVQKWKKHAEKLIPGVRAVIVRKWTDLVDVGDEPYTFVKVLPNGVRQECKRWRRRGRLDRPEVFIFPRDKGKLGYSWRLGVQARVRQRVFENTDTSKPPIRVLADEFRCPTCGAEVCDDKGLPANLSHFATMRRDRPASLRAKRSCTEPMAVLIGENGESAPMAKSIAERMAREYGRGGRRWAVRTLEKDGEEIVCGAPLWQANAGFPDRNERIRRRVADEVGLRRLYRELPRPGTAPRRMGPVAYLRHRRVRFDYYFPDEVHELKGGNTLQGQMFADLCGMSDHIVCLTGTLVGGYAENLLHILWRVCPQRLIADGLTHTSEGFAQFNRTYGVVSKESRTVGGEDTTHADLVQGRGGKNKTSKTKSLPGISPLLFTHYLMDCSTFVRLLEMHEHLPEFDERIHVVPLNQGQAQGLEEMQGEWEQHLDYMASIEQPSRAWSAARHAFLRWPDRPWPEATVWDSDEVGNRFPAFSIPALSPDQEFAKERRLRRIVTLAKARGRKTWVFTEMTGERWDVTPRLKEYLERHGLRVEILRSGNDGGPDPENREAWIAKNAPGVDVIISNPNLVKTGLDLYDFPEIAFYFTGDNTYTLRQAARRAWRLGQKNRCVVHYLVYGSLDALAPPEDAEWSAVDRVSSADIQLLGLDAQTFRAADRDMAMRVLRGAYRQFCMEWSDGDNPAKDHMLAAGAAVYDKLRQELRARNREAVANRTEGTDVPHGPSVTCVQSAALSLMSKKMAASLAIEGDFSDDGLAAMSDSDDIGSQLAKVIAGKLQVEDVRTSFAKYREKLRATLPNLASGLEEMEEEEAVEFDPIEPLESEPVGVEDEDDGWDGAEIESDEPPLFAPHDLFSITATAPPKAAPAAARSTRPAPARDIDRFARPGLQKSEPASISERKRMRLEALVAVLGSSPDDASGDVHRFGDQWVHLVGKHRRTFRDRNLARALEFSNRAWVAFAEPTGEREATESHDDVIVDGVEYRVSGMTALEYIGGCRVPRSLTTIGKALT